MRRTMLLCAVLAIACTSSEKPAAGDSGMAAAAPTPPPAITLAEVAGTWEGSVTAAGNDTVLAVQLLTATADTSGWSMKIANAKTPTKMTTVPATHVVAAGDSIVVDAGPFESVLRAGQKVTTHAIYRLQGGKLVGMVHAMYPNGDMVMLSSSATRKPPM